MSCCEDQCRTGTTTSRSCPACRTAGPRVEEPTVKALLASEALQRLEPGVYRFCPSPQCRVVYFSDKGQTFTTGEIRVGVWQKEPEGARVLCYCFGENETDIREELARDGSSRAVERVRAHIQAGRCACETRNPRGACCLGDIAAAVKRLAATVTAGSI